VRSARSGQREDVDTFPSCVLLVAGVAFLIYVIASMKGRGRRE